MHALAAVNRRMAALVARSADRAFVSASAWTPLVAPLVRRGVDVEWLPVPSAIPPVRDPGCAAAVRALCGNPRALIGHFGTYGDLIVPLLAPAIARLAKSADIKVLLIGAGGPVFRRAIVAAHPDIADRVIATGELKAEDVSSHIAVCDVMLQPYPDGISTRRTSAIAALAHGKPIVSTDGHLTDAFWRNHAAVVLVPAADPAAMAVAARELLDDPGRRRTAGAHASALYDDRFDVRHTIDALQASVVPAPAFAT
jgi:hypothetical protein